MKLGQPILGGALSAQPDSNAVAVESATPMPRPTGPRSFDRVKPVSGAIELEVMDYTKGAYGLRPLLILSQIDFPFPPSIEFCETMKQNGYRVIFIRRLGFGGTPELPRALLAQPNIKNGAAMMAEVALLMRVIETMKLENIVLLGVSSANSICYRLSLACPKIRFSVFSHPIFNQDTFRAVSPAWLQPLARQIILTEQGFKLAARGLRFRIKRNAIGFYGEFYSKSSADLKYLRENEEDFLDAAQFVARISADTLFYEVFHTLAVDPFLRDGLFLNVPCACLVGRETTADWIASAESEADRLNVPIVQAPKGGILSAYACPDQLLQAIKSHSS